MLIPIDLIIAILGFLFSVLVILIGALINTLGKNTEAFKKIEIALAKRETADKYVVKECDTRHTYVNSKLAEHSSKIEAHGMIIQEHEYKIKNLQEAVL